MELKVQIFDDDDLTHPLSYMLATLYLNPGAAQDYAKFINRLYESLSSLTGEQKISMKRRLKEHLMAWIKEGMSQAATQEVTIDWCAHLLFEHQLLSTELKKMLNSPGGEFEKDDDLIYFRRVVTARLEEMEKKQCQESGQELIALFD